MSILVFFSSCRDKENEVIDLNDIIEGSDRYNEDSLDVENKINETDTLQVYLNDFQSHGIEVKELNYLDDNYFPD